VFNNLEHPKTTIESVTIIKIDFQASQDETVIQNAVNFLENHNFTSTQEIVVQENDVQCLKTTYSNYYPSIFIEADKYDLIRDISEGEWHTVKQAFISLVRHGANNSESSMVGQLWSADPVPPNPDATEYTPVRIPLLGFALRVSYCRKCDDVPQECGLVNY